MDSDNSVVHGTCNVDKSCSPYKRESNPILQGSCIFTVKRIILGNMCHHIACGFAVIHSTSGISEPMCLDAKSIPVVNIF